MLNQSGNRVNQPNGSIWLTSKSYKATLSLCDTNLSEHVWFSYPDRGDGSAGEFYFSHKVPLELIKPLCMYSKNSHYPLDLAEDNLYLLVHSNGQDWNLKRYRYGDNYNVWQQYFTIGRYQSSSPFSSPSLYRKVPVMEWKLNLNSFCKYDYRDKECISESIAVNCNLDTKLEKDCNKITNEARCNQYAACRWSSN